MIWIVLVFGCLAYCFARKYFGRDRIQHETVIGKLIEFAETDKMEEFKTTLESNPDSAAVYLNTQGCLFLKKAAISGSLGIVKLLLLEKKIDVNCEESNALFCAASMGRSELVRFLLQQGARQRPNGYGRETPLLVATGTNPAKWVEKEKYDFSKIDMLSVVKILVENGADIHALDKNGETAIHKAAFVQNYSIVEFLLDGKANPDTRDNYGRTPLHQAAFTNTDNRVCRLLLERGANSSIKNRTGQTPILWGHNNIDTSTINLFVRYGYKPVGDVDADGYTLLHRALGSNQLATFNYLLERKADINAATKQGITPFHIAARLRGKEGVDVLATMLLAGARINAVDASGHTPLFYISHVVESDHGTYFPDPLIVNFLKEHGAHE